MGGSEKQGDIKGYRVFVWEDEQVLEMDNGVGCTTLWMYLMPQNCILKMVKMANDNFNVMYILSTMYQMYII